MNRVVPIIALVLAACGTDARSKDNSPSVGSGTRRATGNGSGNGSGLGRGGEDSEETAVDPAKLFVTVRVGGTDVIVPGAKLLAIPREAPPGEVEGGTGWRISTILKLAGVHDAKRVVLANATGATLALDGAFGDLDERGAVAYVKLNRQGALRFRMYRKVGESWQSGATLRDVTRLDVQ